MSLLGTLQEQSEDAAQAGEYGGAPEAYGIESIDGIPYYIEHHLEDSRLFEFAGLHFDLNAFALPPIHLGPVTLDLSPTRQLIFMFLSAFVCMAIFIPMARAMKTRDPQKAPSGFHNAMEAMVLYFRNEVVRPAIGHGADGYTPYILTVFFFVLFMNLFGLTPFGITATANLSVTAGMALISFIVVEVSGMRALGAGGYAKTIFYLPAGLPGWIKPIMLVIMTIVEALGKLTKPFALAIRLFANMMAGHILLLAVIGIVLVQQSFVVGAAAVAGLSILMILKLFVAFVQAYIFAMLTSVFIGQIRHAH